MQQVVLKQIRFKNVFSFGNVVQSITFENGVRKITGINLDKGGSNGSGKTSLMNIVSIALYGKPCDDAIEDIQNYTNNKKATPGWTEIEFCASNIDYRCTRTFTGASSTVALDRKSDNGEWEEITLGRSTSTNQLLVDILNMPFEIFQLSQIYSGKVTPFLERTAAEQRQITDFLFDTQNFSTDAENLKSIRSQVDTDIKLKEQEIAFIKNANQSKIRANELNQQKFDSYEQRRNQDIETLTNQCTTKYEFDRIFETFDLCDEIVEEIADAKLNISTLQRSMTDVGKSISTKRNELAHLESGNCPYCAQAFTSDEKKRTLYRDVESLTMEQTALSDSLVIAESSLQELKSVLSDVMDSVPFKSRQDAIKMQQVHQTADSELQRLKTAVNPYAALIEESIEVQDYSIQESELDALKDKLNHVKLLLQLLTNRDSILRTTIIRAKTHFLNERIAHYAKILDLPQVLHFDPNLKCKVVEFGRTTSYGNLSAGERRRANLSLFFAFKDVVKIKFGGSNILFLDEIDGGALDEQACISIASALADIAREDSLCLWVISHQQTVIKNINREIIVKKELGFSTVV